MRPGCCVSVPAPGRGGLEVPCWRASSSGAKSGWLLPVDVDVAVVDDAVLSRSRASPGA